MLVAITKSGPSDGTTCGAAGAAWPAERAELWDLLGGVRFLLAMVVVTAHGTFLHQSCWAARLLVPLGAFPAVLCFLVVSGFSIGHSFARRPAGFLGRRFRRIYPLYALAVLASVVPDVVNGGPVPAGWGQAIHSQWTHTLVGNLLFTQTFHYGAIASNGVVWSLAVEAAFYLATPLLARMATAHLLALAGLSAVAFAVFPRTGLAYYASLRHGLPVLFLGWAWLAGFIYYRVRADGRAGVGLIVAVLALMAVNRTYTEDRSVLLMLASLSTLVFGGAAKLPAVVRRPLAVAGDLSYPLYLFHAPVLLIYGVRFGGQSQWLFLAMALPLAVAMLAVDAALRRPVAAAWDAATAAGRSVRTAAAVATRVVAAPLVGVRGLMTGLASPAINISIAAGVALVAIMSTVARR